VIGVGFAATILVSWGAVEWLGLFAVELRRDGWFAVPLLVPATTFLYTGLFITAHDAMHGIVSPRHRRLNDSIGRLAVFLYALFSYERLVAEHRKHHRAPGTEEDPDFHRPTRGGLVTWYLDFLRHYVTPWQLAGMAAVYNCLQFGFGVPSANLMVFWVLPSLASTVQLFYFGTYLPHREEEERPFADQHRARTIPFNRIVSLLTCYHFGRHQGTLGCRWCSRWRPK
jgi:beta-carotene/zeaxanthin 4-ketolase